MKPHHRAFAVGVSAIWGINFIITKIGLEELTPIFFTCLRYSAIAFPLVFFVKRDGLSWSLILQIGLCLGTFTFTLAFIGIKLGVPAGLTSLLMQFQVVIIVILSALLLKDMPTKTQIAGIAMSTAGLAMLISGFAGSATLTGLFFVLAGAVCAALSKILIKRGGEVDTFRLMVWMSIVPPVPLLLLSLLVESGQWQSLTEVSYRGIGAVLFNAFVSTVLGFGLNGYLVKLYSPNKVAPYAFLVPVFGLAGGYLFLGERLDAYTIMACLVIMTGLVYPRLVLYLKQRLAPGRPARPR